jgi:hypothetical protein
MIATDLTGVQVWVAAARIIPEPSAVCRPHEMMGENGHDDFLRSNLPLAV